MNQLILPLNLKMIVPFLSAISSKVKNEMGFVLMETNLKKDAIQES